MTRAIARAIATTLVATVAGLGLAAGLATGLSSCAHNDREGSGFIEGQPDGGGTEKGTFNDASGPLEPQTTECADETKQIYVVGTDKSFYRFYPADLKFVRIGSLGCPTGEGTFSMAIDRYGIAWIEYFDGRLYAFNTFDGSCKATAFKPGQTGFEQFGMGFALNGDDPKAGETLYIAGSALGAIDTKTFDVKFLGSITSDRTELTGMGSALYAYSINSGVVARLNKANGTSEATYRTSAIDSHGGFAFAQWGGQFWIFTGRTTSTVTTYSPDTDDSKVVMPNTGMLIVGAGSSTCAPNKPLK